MIDFETEALPAFDMADVQPFYEAESQAARDARAEVKTAPSACSSGRPLSIHCHNGTRPEPPGGGHFSRTRAL
jgi:hypothetical protein